MRRTVYTVKPAERGWMVQGGKAAGFDGGHATVEAAFAAACAMASTAVRDGAAVTISVERAPRAGRVAIDTAAAGPSRIEDIPKLPRFLFG